MRRKALPAPAPRARRRMPRASAALVPAALALVGGPTALSAQQAAQTNPQITTTLSQRFEVDSNIDLDDPSPGTSYFTDTRLAVGLLNETEDQVFALGFDTGIRALWRAEEDFEFIAASPSTASLDFGQDWASGSFETSLRYRQRRVDFERTEDDFLDPDTGVIVTPDDPALLEGETTERRYDGTIDLELATDAPSSYAFTLSATRIDYSETSADEVPRTTVDTGALWRLQLTPVISSALFARYFYYEAENIQSTQITESEVDAGVIWEPSEVLQVTAGLGYADREQSERIGGAGPRQTIEDNSGISARAGVAYDFEDFVVNATLRVTDAAPETRVSGDARVTYPLQRSALNARVFQNYAGGTGGEEIRITGAGFGLLRELDQISRVGFDVAFTRRENQDDPTDPDIDRLDFTATYSYDFTEAISADLGYRFRNRDEGEENATSHAVFVQIGRTFVTRP